MGDDRRDLQQQTKGRLLGLFSIILPPADMAINKTLSFLIENNIIKIFVFYVGGKSFIYSQIDTLKDGGLKAVSFLSRN